MCGFAAGSLWGCFNPPAPLPDAAPDSPRIPFDSPWGPGDVFDGPHTDLGPWGPASLVLSAMGDDDPTLTDDRLELYFNRNGDIYRAARLVTFDSFEPATLVTELSSSFPETTPEISPDGLTIYFASRRTPTLGVEDIWMSTRAARNVPWDMPVHVPELSSSGFDGSATPDANELAFVLYSDRGGTLELYETVRTSTADPWPAPGVHGELTSGVGDYDPMLSLDRETIYYDSSVSGGGDLYMATRPGFVGAFGTPQPIDELNTALYLEEDPWISLDGRHMYFASNRDGTLGIYEASR